MWILEQQMSNFITCFAFELDGTKYPFPAAPHVHRLNEFVEIGTLPGVHDGSDIRVVRGTRNVIPLSAHR
jgi:hypothetical protein